ncbi:hypothetical protein [Roseateles sp. YR242]|uniref:hypothetical protein n=1 Tax=Roseateles sp. YR242 TaxID=1855305 RepID=UPI000B81872D|nr:hypothetical protein [Roseateles sp. YR242]
MPDAIFSVGNEQHFSIDYAGCLRENLVPVRVWFKGLPIGTLEEPTYMPSFIANLRLLIHPPAESRIGAARLVAFGDTFDDFLVEIIRETDHVLNLRVELLDAPFRAHPAWRSRRHVRVTLAKPVLVSVVNEMTARVNAAVV